VLAENVANVDTPDYHTQAARSGGVPGVAGGGAGPHPGAHSARWNCAATRNSRRAPNGRVEVAPAVEPAQNVLFHDGTNARLERLHVRRGAENLLNYDLR
jgi:hypothetical protein